MYCTCSSSQVFGEWLWSTIHNRVMFLLHFLLTSSTNHFLQLHDNVDDGRKTKCFLHGERGNLYINGMKGLKLRTYKMVAKIFHLVDNEK